MKNINKQLTASITYSENGGIIKPLDDDTTITVKVFGEPEFISPSPIRSVQFENIIALNIDKSGKITTIRLMDSSRNESSIDMIGGNTVYLCPSNDENIIYCVINCSESPISLDDIKNN